MFSAGIEKVLPAVNVSPAEEEIPPDVCNQYSNVCAARVGTSEVTVIEAP